MDYEVVYSAQARRDLRAIVDFWALKDPAAAQLLGTKLADRAISLSYFPYSGACVSKRSHVRKLIYAPYHTIYYSVNEERRQVELVRIWDGRRNPADLELPREDQAAAQAETAGR